MLVAALVPGLEHARPGVPTIAQPCLDGIGRCVETFLVEPLPDFQSQTVQQAPGVRYSRETRHAHRVDENGQSFANRKSDVHRVTTCRPDNRIDKCRGVSPVRVKVLQAPDVAAKLQMGAIEAALDAKKA